MGLGAMLSLESNYFAFTLFGKAKNTAPTKRETQIKAIQTVTPRG